MRMLIVSRLSGPAQNAKQVLCETSAFNISWIHRAGHDTADCMALANDLAHKITQEHSSKNVHDMHIQAKEATWKKNELLKHVKRAQWTV